MSYVWLGFFNLFRFRRKPSISTEVTEVTDEDILPRPRRQPDDEALEVLIGMIEDDRRYGKMRGYK
jgi:hypothetical protein